jgi:hypothetical protein
LEGILSHFDLSFDFDLIRSFLHYYYIGVRFADQSYNHHEGAS